MDKKSSDRRISVIIPVYQAERFIEEAVRSALAQEEVGEVLLVEDGSTDGSLKICTELARDARVTLLQHPGGGNHGVAESRNVGIRAAKANLIAFLDVDDYYLPGRFRKAVSILDSNPDIDGVYEAVGTWFKSEQQREWYKKHYLGDGPTTMRERVAPEELFRALLMGNKGFIHTNGITVRKSLFAKTGEFEPSLRMCEDSAMWYQMALVGRLVPGRLEEPVAVRRVHGENSIIIHAEQHLVYAVQSGHVLLRWAATKNLSRDQIDGLIERFIAYWHKTRHPERGYVRQKARDVWFLSSAPVRHPVLFGSRRFWREVVRATGLRRVESLL